MRRESRESSQHKNAGQFYGLAAGIAGVVFFVFWPVMRNGFVNYDDPDYVTANFIVQKGITWQGIVWAFQSVATAANWHPLTWLSHMLDCQLWDLNPAGHHFSSLLLHSVNAALVFCFLARATNALWPSAFVAGFFGLHPLRVESVAWVSERKDVLSAFFFLLALISYESFARKKSDINPARGITAHPIAAGGPCRNFTSGLPASFYFLLTLGLFAFALMSKPMAVTFPLVLLLLDYWPLRRWQRGKILALFVEKGPFLLLSAVSSILTLVVQKRNGAVVSDLSLSTRIGNAFVSYWRYVAKLIWPQNLAAIYPYPGTWPPFVVASAAVGLLGLTILVLLAGRKRMNLVFGWFWFIGMLAPVIGLVQAGSQSIADRYTYLPSIGLLVVVVWGGVSLARRPMLHKSLQAAGIAVLALYATSARSQIAYWSNTKTLFEHAIAVTKDNYIAHENLAAVLNAEGRFDEAFTHIREALLIKPDFAVAHNDMGDALLTLGRVDEAIRELQTAVRMDPHNAKAHSNLGAGYALKGELSDAIKELQIAVQLDSANEGARKNLARALELQKDRAQTQNR